MTTGKSVASERSKFEGKHRRLGRRLCLANHETPKPLRRDRGAAAIPARHCHRMGATCQSRRSVSAREFAICRQPGQDRRCRGAVVETPCWALIVPISFRNGCPSYGRPSCVHRVCRPSSDWHRDDCCNGHLAAPLVMVARPVGQMNSCATMRLPAVSGPRLTGTFRKPDQNGSASEGPMLSPTISRRPSLDMGIAIIAVTETMRPPSRTLR